MTEKGFRGTVKETPRTEGPWWWKRFRVLRKGLQRQGKELSTATKTGLSRDRDRPIAMKKTGSSQGRSVSHKRQRKRIAGKAKGTGQPHHLSYSGGPVASFKRREYQRRPGLAAGRLCGGRSCSGRRESPGESTSGFLEDSRNPARDAGKTAPFEGSTGHFEERAHPGFRFPEREAPVRIPGLGITPLSTFFF